MDRPPFDDPDDAAGDPAAADPIEVLLDEHRTILQVVDEVEREGRRLEQGQPLREGFWRDVLHFADEFDRRLHHHKEELLLFPALERAGLSADRGPTAVLRDEHLRIERWRDRIERALTGRDVVRLAAAATQYNELTRAHVLKENQILFPLVRRVLPPDQLAALQREFGGLLASLPLRRWIRADLPTQ